MSHPIIPIDLNGCDFQHVQILWAPAKWYLWVSVHLFLYVDKQYNITYQPVFPTVLMHPGLQKKGKKKNAESRRKSPLPRPSCVHSREKRPDGQWVELSGGPAGLHLLPHIRGSSVRAGLGARSRTKSVNVKTSVWLEGPLDKLESDLKLAKQLRTAVSFLLVWGIKCQHDIRCKGKTPMNGK